MEVDNDSKQLLTIIMHYEFYFNHLFGIKSMPVMLQQTMDAILTGLTRVAFYLNVIATGSTQGEL